MKIYRVIASKTKYFSKDIEVNEESEVFDAVKDLDPKDFERKIEETELDIVYPELSDDNFEIEWEATKIIKEELV